MRLLLLLTTLTAACGANLAPPASLDAGDPAPDAGRIADAGISAEDGGSSPDAGSAPEDAGLPADSGYHCPEGYPMEDYAGKPVVEVAINGNGPYRFIYDTGAPTSGIDLSLGARIGAGPYIVEIGGRHFDVPRFDQSDIHSSLRSNTIDGVVGADLFGVYIVSLDVQRRRYWLDEVRDEPALLACGHTAGRPVEIGFIHDNYDYLPGRAEGIEGWFLLDSGASLGAMPDPIVDQLLAANPRPALENMYTPAAIGIFWARMLTVADLEVGGLTVRHITTRSVPSGLLPVVPTPDQRPFLGVLPTLFLKHFLITRDPYAGVIRFDAYVDDPLREPSEFFVSGISLARSTTVAVVSSVIPGSGAEVAGIAPGDRVISVDGRTTASLDAYSWPWMLMGREERQSLDVVIERAGLRRHHAVVVSDALEAPER